MTGSIEAEIFAQALTAPEIERELDDYAAKVCAYAQSIAPVFGDRPEHRESPPAGSPGDYRESIHVESGGRGARRVITRDDPIALWVELGTAHMPEYAVFSKTAEHFGGTAPQIGDAGVMHAQGHLREAIKRLGELHAANAGADEIAAQANRVRQARVQRSAEFRAGRNARRRTRRAGTIRSRRDHGR